MIGCWPRAVLSVIKLAIKRAVRASSERVRLRGSSLYFKSLVDSRGTNSLLSFGGGVNAGHTREMKSLSQFCET